MNAIQTLGDAVSKLGKQINDLQREVSGRKSHAHRLSLELKQSESWRESLSKDLEALRSSVDSERGEIITELQLANDAIARLEASNSALSSDCNARQAREQEMGTVIVALQSELKSLNDQLTQCCAMNVDIQAAIERLTKELNDAQKNLESAEAARNDLDQQYRDLRIAADLVTSDRNLVVDQRQALQNQVAELNANLSKAVDSHVKAEQRALDMKMEISALQFTVEKRNEAIDRAIVYANSLPADMYDGDENLIPVAEALLSILKQGAQK